MDSGLHGNDEVGVESRHRFMPRVHQEGLMVQRPHSDHFAASKLRLFLPLLISLCGCRDEAEFRTVRRLGDDGVLGGVEKPVMATALREASDPQHTDQEGRLIYERCKKLSPIVEPRKQLWHCDFGFQKNAIMQNCSVVMSVQPFDHFGVWYPLRRIDSKTREGISTLVCKEKT